MTDQTKPDHHFAEFICRLANLTETADEQLLRQLSARTSAALRDGHICLDLTAADLRSVLPDAEQLACRLYKTGVVGRPGERKPLILDGAGRLYLYRYHAYEQKLAAALLQKAAVPQIVDEATLQDGLQRYFPDSDDQQQAAITALKQQLCIICGGPGTGKTSTVVRILALLLEQSLNRQQNRPTSPLRIALAAPTGKAAARLKESILQAKQSIHCSEQVKELLPDRATTLHSLLGYRHNSSRFRHDQENPLPLDLLIVDEASMISLPLMAKLVAALPSAAKLMLLGDRDQLASVEAGAVLGDICPADVELSGNNAPLKNNICILRKSYRFGEQGEIAGLAAAINSGDSGQVLDLLSVASESLSFRPLLPATRLKQQLKTAILDGFISCFKAKTAEEALKHLADFRILTPLRQGSSGVAGLNRLVEEILTEEKLIPAGRQWYKGRPVMITVNAPQLQLFNGDIGIVWPDPAADNQLRVCFTNADGEPRWLVPLRLPAHETAFALTIHKSQGSEFTNLLMLLPAEDNPVLTRELLYTGITRARKRVEIWGKAELLPTIIARRIERNSGLKDALWGELA